MKINMGGADRYIRVLLAIIFIALYFTNTVTGPVGITLFVLAIIFLATSTIGSCPLYTLLHINTRRKKASS